MDCVLYPWASPEGTEPTSGVTAPPPEEIDDCSKTDILSSRCGGGGVRSQ